MCGCGAKFSVEHTAPKVVSHPYDITRSEIYPLTQVCSDVCIEPEIQPLTGKVLSDATSNAQDGVRLDIAANGCSLLVVVTNTTCVDCLSFLSDKV